MMRKTAIATALVGLGATVVSTASAAIVDFTYHGTVAQLSDPSGVFAQAGNAAPYTLVFRADITRGAIFSGGGGYADGVVLLGGSNSSADAGQPTIRLSPVSAILTIHGESLVFAGVNDGEASSVNNYFGDIIGKPSEDFSSLSQSAADQRDNGSISLTDSISSGVSLPPVPFDNPIPPLTLQIDGIIVQSFGLFDYQYRDLISRRSIAVSGTLKPTNLTIAAVPEPDSFLLVLCSMGLAAAYRASYSSSGRIQYGNVKAG